jgi:L-amino acid N-acyltransferase YncA
VGYYSVAILPEHRQNGYAKEAVAKLIGIKAAGVDVVRAMICAANIPSLALAESLGVQVKLASIQVPGLLKRQL